MERLSSVVQLAPRGRDRKPLWGEEAPGRCTWRFAGAQPGMRLPGFAECLPWLLLHWEPPPLPSLKWVSSQLLSGPDQYP